MSIDVGTLFIVTKHMIGGFPGGEKALRYALFSQDDLPVGWQTAMSSTISALAKNIPVLFFGILWSIPPVPPRLQRGVWPIVTKRGARDAMKCGSVAGG
jgi:hypothetical protein